ncbi:MAG TPA: hypothetical protein VGN41_00265 [Streptosporangiaceae bacterium]|jgi:uncharacterized membrane protein
MTPELVISHVSVPLVGVIACAAPAGSPPVLQFGVRVPGEHAGAPVIRHQRYAYYLRTAIIAACFTASAVLLPRSAPWFLAGAVLLLELAADLGCFWLARERITAVKHAEHWFEGVRQTVVTDTSWRTRPIRFPAAWLVPAVAVAIATGIIGALRYPDLPSHLATTFTASGAPGRVVRKSVFSVFAVVAAQVWVTLLWPGLLLIIYRSRPDVDASDPAASAGRYRRFLLGYARALLTLVALVNVSLLLSALRRWQVYRLAGGSAVLPFLPGVAGVLILLAVALRMGQAGFRLRRTAGGPGPGAGGPGPGAGAARDDDRFWKGGLIYVNRDDPAIIVGSRFGVGFIFNLGNPMAWLVCGTIVAVPAGLAVLRAVAGL